MPLLPEYDGKRHSFIIFSYGDLQGNEISVKNGEVNEFVFYEEEFEFRSAGKKVEDYTKSEAGARRLPYTESAKNY